MSFTRNYVVSFSGVGELRNTQEMRKNGELNGDFCGGWCLYGVFSVGDAFWGVSGGRLDFGGFPW